MSEKDIVISGMSGRLPQSESTDEFASNLYNNVDMVTEDDSRWPTDIYGMNHRMGRIKEFDKFDGSFFGLMQQMFDELDPQSRILLETTYEAIIDSGINPQNLIGSQTGVYMGVCNYAMSDGLPEDIQPDQQICKQQVMLQTMGNAKSLYANRISYAFDFKGPSLIVDTACSASLVAFNLAINDLKQGNVDYAIVGGANMAFEPHINLMTQEVNLCSPRGVSAVLDQNADGFVRGEAVVCLLLQKRSTAKRIYATVLNSRVNIDGRKTFGMFHPSPEAQRDLMVMACKEANVDPLKVNYFEAHATGTRAGDPQEVKAIYNAYCVNREDRLPLGLLKSNIGHTEGASGVSAVVKVLLAFENECIPANLNLKKIKDECAVFCPPLYPITENFKYTPGIAGINNFGVGGVNAHILIEANHKLFDENYLKIAEDIPRIVNICGRTEESIKYLFDFIEKNPNKISRDFLALLTETMKYEPNINSTGLPYRGSIIMKKLNEENNNIKYEYKKQFSVLKNKTKRPVWLLFPGLGGEWPAMAKALMPIKTFADKIEECHQILSEFGIDLKYLLLSEDIKTVSTMTYKFCSKTSIEIALFEVIKALDITPDGIIGHSFGEIACAYADGCLTTREALAVTYFRGEVTENDKEIPRGLMAVVGLSKVEMKKLCPKGVYVVCNNAKETVVISGPYNDMKSIIKTLNQKGVFVRELQSSEIPYHSEYLLTSAEKMKEKINKYIVEPKLRSKKWVSTSVMGSETTEALKYASADYFVYNLLNSVHFFDKFKELPNDAIIIELSPHSVFNKIVSETLESSSYISLLKKDSNDTNLDLFLQSIAKLYELGLNPSIENLYPRVEWPVARNTQSIGSLMKWDHSISYFVRKYPEFYNRSTASDMNATINIVFKEQAFYADHAIDGNALFPATGYLMLAWRQMASTLSRFWNQIPAVFEDIQFRRPVFLSESTPSRLKVRYFENSGDFVILENSNVCCVGKIHSPSEDTLFAQNLINKPENNVTENVYTLETDDIYKELRVMGYDYGPQFQRLKKVKTSDFKTVQGHIEWDGNFITFLDSLLQSMAFAMPFRKLMVPVMIKYLRCDPKIFFEAVQQNKFEEKVKIDDFENRDVAKEELCAVKDKDDFKELDQSNEILEAFYRRFHIYKSNIPFHFDSKSRLLVTPGIEVENVMAYPVPRKSDTQDLKLDSYLFVANEDDMAFDEYQKKQVLNYIEVCKTLASKAKQIGFNEIKCDFNYKMCSEETVDEYRNLNHESYVLFKIFDKIFNTMSDENKNLDKNLTENKMKCLINEIQNNPEFDISKDIVNQINKNERLMRTVLDLISENLVPKKELKILEINVSKAFLANQVLQHMANYHLYPIDIEYKIAVKSMDGLNDKYKQLSIEWNPENSDFPSDITLTDLLILKDTQDLWHLDLEKHIQDIYDSIVENGFLLSVFKYKFTEPEMAFNSMNGKKFVTDLDLKERIDNFVETAQKFGFAFISRKSDSIASMAILFRKISNKANVPDINQVIEIDSNYEKWFQLLKEKLIFGKENEDKVEKLWLISRQSSISGILGLINCLRLEPGGQALRCVFDFDNSIKNGINFNSKPFSDILNNDLVINVIKNQRLGTYRHLKLSKDYDKRISNEYYLNIGQTRDLSSLQWFDMKNLKKRVFYDINNNSKIKQIHCNIYYSGLTFRDVLIATGRIPTGPQLLFTDCVIGCEFAGRRGDTGERVMGFEIRCFATSINASEHMITHIPDHWSMEEAVTVVSNYGTLYYGLIERANLKRGESILIHSSAGGIGQSAINICKYFECDIYCTVGTEEKKQFLINEYNIPENRIFSSRDIQFKYRILELTNGRGVDLVLNSLAGDKLMASYECVANRGRFLELGKYDLFMNKQLGMFSFIRDISFIGVAIDMPLTETREFTQRFYDWMHKNCTNGCVKPINTTVFTSNEVEKAFRHMTTGKHIGKLVIKIRDEEMNQKSVKQLKPTIDMLSTTKTFFDSNKVYIITGGLGGFGLELVHWMLYLGAQKFILTSRTGVKTDYQKLILKRLEAFGQTFKIFETKIIVSTHDCNTIEGSKQLISEANSLGPIGGVFHLALVLNDCLLENQTLDKFNETIDCKYKTFANLDKMSRSLEYKLDYFVVFSSLACGLGNIGQSNYAFGNSMCERICEQRRKDGLHGLAIQWGPIGDVGVMADTDNVLSFSTVVKQRINSCLDAMDSLLQINEPIVTSFIRTEKVQQTGSRQKRMVKELWRALGIDPDTTPDHLTLGEIGMESMFAVELQQELEREYNIKMSINHIKSITIKMLKDYESGRVENIKAHVDQLKTSRARLLKYKFIIPTDAVTKLNDVNTGKPVYILPPMETTFTAFEDLAKKIERPVFGLNWTRSLNNFSSLKEIDEYYVNLMKTLSPNVKYDILGYFDGALIALKLLRKSMVEKAVIIDILSESQLSDDFVTDDSLLEFIFKSISLEIPETFRDKIFRDLKTEPNIDQKIKRICSEVREFAGKGLVSNDLDDIFRSALKRAKLMVNYRADKKKKLTKIGYYLAKKWIKISGKLIIIKPLKSDEQNDEKEFIQKTRHHYFLPKPNEFGEKIAFESVDENSFSISSGNIAEKIISCLK